MHNLISKYRLLLRSVVKNLLAWLKQKIHDPYFIIFCVVLLGGLFFRFYNAPARYGFDFDAVRDALVSFEGAHHLRFPLVGPLSAQGAFTFGPWYYYVLIIATIIFPFGYAPWFAMGLLSVFVIFASYAFGVVFGSKKYGIILAILTAFSTSQIVLSTNLSNPDMIPILSWISLILFILFLKKSLPYYLLILWGLCLGVGFFSHFQMLGLFILPVIACLYKKKNSIYNSLLIILGLLMSSIPTFLFDLQHNWYTTKGFIYYILHGSLHPNYYPNSWRIYLLDFWPGFWTNTLGIPTDFGIFLLIAIFLLFIFLFVKKRLSGVLFPLVISFGIIFIAFRYYSGERAIYYLYFLQPFVFIFTGFLIWKLGEIKRGKYAQAFLVILFLFIAVPANVNQLQVVDSHKNYSEFAQKIIGSNKNRPIKLYMCKNSIKNQAYAISYILATSGKLSDNGTKIGIYDENCIPGQNISIILSQHLNVSEINLSSYTPDELRSKQWFIVSPKTVYDTIAVPIDAK